MKNEKIIEFINLVYGLFVPNNQGDARFADIHTYHCIIYHVVQFKTISFKFGLPCRAMTETYIFIEMHIIHPDKY